MVGVVAEAELGNTVRYVFTDGRTTEVVTANYRVLTPHGWDGELVVLGQDQAGDFVASFSTQADMPADCYVENSKGVDRGAYVQLRGVLWRKASGFQSATQPPNGAAFPGGTRFCLDDQGLITNAVAP
jgi:hypothetical protein